MSGLIAILFVLFTCVGIPAAFVFFLVYAKNHSAHGQRERMIRELKKRGGQ